MQSVRLILCAASLCILLAANAPAAEKAPACDIPATPDYAKTESWASRPAEPTKPVDVFYVYPTIYPGSSPKNMGAVPDN